MAEKPDKQQQLPSVIDRALHLPAPPFWLVSAVLVFVVLSWLPLVMIARSKVTTSPNQKIHLLQDMDNQPRYNAQAVNPDFKDDRAMRRPVAGTVAWGERFTQTDPDALRESDHYYRGYTQVRDPETGERQAAWYQGLPPRSMAQLNESKTEYLVTGQNQFNIYCAPCHGEAGYGGATGGKINLRAQELTVTGDAQWAPSANLHETRLHRQNYPDGKLYNTIRNGFGQMHGYASQIETKDRWAIVAYIRALQLSQNPNPSADNATADASEE